MESELKATTNKLLVDIDKCNSNEDLFKLEFCKKGSNEIEKIIADIFSDAEETYKNNKKMCLNLNQIIKLLKICEHKNIKSFCWNTLNKYKYVLEDIIVPNDKAQILFSDFMLIIRSFSCKDYCTYFTSKEFASFITQNIKQKFLNAVEENDNNIVSTDNKILCDDNGDKLTPGEMMLIRSKTYMRARFDLDKWIWQQFVDSDWDLEQVFNFFKLNGDLYPMEPVTNSSSNNRKLVDIDDIFREPRFSKEFINAIKKKNDSYIIQILSDEKTDCLTLEEVKIIAMSNFSFNKNHEVSKRFLNRIPKQIDFCYFRCFVSILAKKELAEQNLIDQKLINSYMALVKTNSKYEEDALDKIKNVKEDFEYWTPKATNLRIEKDWERFKSEESSLICYYTLTSIEDDLRHKLGPGQLDPDLADKIISEIANFGNKDSKDLLVKISTLIKAKRSKKNLIYSDTMIDGHNTNDTIKNTIQQKQPQSNTNSIAPEAYGKDNTGRPWYVILGHILTLGIFLWIPLLFNCMFGCCCGKPEESNLKKISVPIVGLTTHTTLTTNTIAQSSMNPNTSISLEKNNLLSTDKSGNKNQNLI